MIKLEDTKRIVTFNEFKEFFSLSIQKIIDGFFSEYGNTCPQSNQEILNNNNKLIKKIAEENK